MKNTVKKRGRFLAAILSIILVLSVTTVAWATESKAAASPESNFEYTVNSDNTVTITKYKGTEKEVVIPDTIAGKTVTEIKGLIFGGYNEERAPEKITLNKSLVKLDLGCLTYSGMKEFNVDSDNLNFSSYEGIIYDKNYEKLIFSPHGKIVENYIVPKTVKVICKSAFSTDEVRSIVLPDSLVTIEDTAFLSIKGSSQIVLPKNLKTVGEMAFSYSSITSLVFLSEDFQINPISYFNTAVPPDGFEFIGFKGSKAEEAARRDKVTFKEIINAPVSNNPDASVEALVEAGTTLSFYEITSGLDEDSFNNLVKDAQSYTLYNISLKNGEREVQPITGNAKVRFKAPEGYTADSMELYRIDNDAAGGDSGYTQMTTTFDNGFVNFETEHFSSYVLLNMGGESTTTEPTTESTTNGTTVPNTTKQDVPTTEQELTGKNIPKTGDNNVTAISAVVAVAALGVIVLLKKKSKVTVS